ncbi:MAG: F0F1 ATP synthase subunit A [Firmicutes bacterium]|nr:F0F1 ATP synthase subunit A [Clostridiales bacterium]MBQ4340544.1 F0F1 ATP synthase subunit A [Bacillota bacterium]MBR6700779.1 F0F1 ATP synthase subunit A [Bacillota bacterium]
MNTEFGPKIIVEFSNGVFITETVINTWIIMAVLVVVSIILTRNMKLVPDGKQNVAEILVGVLTSLVGSSMGKDKLGFVPYMGTLMIFLVCANLWGLVGFRAPTADLNTTFALSILTFFMIHGNSIRRKGVGGWLKGTFFEPVAVMAPLNLISEVATPVSLAFRLFGNIVGGMIIMALVYNALGTILGGVLPIPIFELGIPAVLHAYFDVFAGVLQAFIFTMLTMVFVSMAMD